MSALGFILFTLLIALIVWGLFSLLDSALGNKNILSVFIVGARHEPRRSDGEVDTAERFFLRVQMPARQIDIEVSSKLYYGAILNQTVRVATTTGKWSGIYYFTRFDQLLTK